MKTLSRGRWAALAALGVFGGSATPSGSATLPATAEAPSARVGVEGGVKPVPAYAIPAFVYEGAGCTGVAALAQYEAVIGRPVDGGTDFLDDSTDWPGLVSETNWALGCWQGAVNNVDVSLPMVVAQHDKNALKELAQGQFNAYVVQVAQSLVNHGFPNAYIRVGWEFNGSWYPWAGAVSPGLWRQGYRQIVTAMRSVPGQHFHFVWNPALYEDQFSPDQAYPGDGVVDVIATDAYNQSWDAGYTVPAAMWDSVDNDSWGVAQIVSFAQQHHKPVAFPEWGTGIRSDGHGGGDDPLFIANMAAVMASTSVAFQSYWDYPAADYNAQISNGQYPAALAAFIAAFGSPSAGTASKVAVVKRTGAIVTANAASAAAGSDRIAVNASGCAVSFQPHGRDHYQIVAWSPGASSSTATTHCEVSWNLAGSVKLYDPKLGSAAIDDVASARRLTLVLKGRNPQIIALAT